MTSTSPQGLNKVSLLQTDNSAWISLSNSNLCNLPTFKSGVMLIREQTWFRIVERKRRHSQSSFQSIQTFLLQKLAHLDSAPSLPLSERYSLLLQYERAFVSVLIASCNLIFVLKRRHSYSSPWQDTALPCPQFPQVSQPSKHWSDNRGKNSYQVWCTSQSLDIRNELYTNKLEQIRMWTPANKFSSKVLIYKKLQH